jgi:predicted Zn-dependent protease with MMP-like domain
MRPEVLNALRELVKSIVRGEMGAHFGLQNMKMKKIDSSKE